MRLNGDHTADPTSDPTDVPTDALTVGEAAEALGITTEAARMRVKRGTLNSTRIDGTVYVLLDRPNPRPNGPNARPNDGPNPRPNDKTQRPNTATATVMALVTVLATPWSTPCRIGSRPLSDS
jgi:hypothetical protein